MDLFNEFCDIAKITEQSSKIEVAFSFMWFHQFKNKKNEISIKEINDYFIKANLSQYNATYLKRDLTRSKNVAKGPSNTFRLNRKVLEDFNKIYLLHLEKEVPIIERANIRITPFLSPTDIEGAKKMAELYIILHCLENSVRNFIIDILEKEIGVSWWDKAKNTDLEKKVKERKEKENKNKWLSPRGNSSPLFYLDWGDLVKIIRKFEDKFKSFFDEMKFIELRLEELEKVRNIIAHNGIIPSDDDFDRVVLHFKDWCKQITHTN